MSQEPKPSIETSYRRADGEHIEDYGWVTDLDWFDDYDDPVELIEERWTRTTVRTFWHMPDRLYSCTKVLDCDEDAVAWEQQDDGKWKQVCEAHDSGAQ
jgi:hypothetical protein